jgi:hypothetical protein
LLFGGRKIKRSGNSVNYPNHGWLAVHGQALSVRDCTGHEAPLCGQQSGHEKQNGYRDEGKSAHEQSSLGIAAISCQLPRFLAWNQETNQISIVNVEMKTAAS